MLSRKTFAMNSLKQNFLKDVLFGCDAGYDNTQSTPNDLNSSIDILPKHNNLVKGAIHSHLITVYPMQSFRPGSSFYDA